MKLTSENKAKLTVKYNGTNVVISDGTNTFTEVVTSRNFTLSKLMSNGVHDDLDGKLFNFKAWSGGDRNTGTLVCDLRSIDEIPTDLTKTHYFTETLAAGGSITYELENQGIFDFNASAKDDEFITMPIIHGTFELLKEQDETYTKLVSNFRRSNVNGQYQESDPDTDNTTIDATITKTHNLDTIKDLTTVQTRGNLLLGINARVPRGCEFETMATGLHIREHQIVNVRHPILRGAMGATAMLAGKWIVLQIQKNQNPMTVTITAIQV